MNDLQDALKRIPADWNGGDPTWRESILVLRKAARRVANPDIEAAASERHRNGRPKCYEGPKEDGCYCWITTRKAVNLALGVTEAPDGQ